ncbi:MAG: hypothetical protein HC822_19445 [Oscillochloris sp.]|nr:hypothetical protein [Oscillochloris sp.]
MFMDLIAVMMGVGMIGGALAGWILIVSLLVSDLLLPRLRELGARTRITERQLRRA